jgi:hypothetical protein
VAPARRPGARHDLHGCSPGMFSPGACAAAYGNRPGRVAAGHALSAVPASRGGTSFRFGVAVRHRPVTLARRTRHGAPRTPMIGWSSRDAPSWCSCGARRIGWISRRGSRRRARARARCQGLVQNLRLRNASLSNRPASQAQRPATVSSAHSADLSQRAWTLGWSRQAGMVAM